MGAQRWCVKGCQFTSAFWCWDEKANFHTRTKSDYQPYRDCVKTGLPHVSADYSPSMLEVGACFAGCQFMTEGGLPAERKRFHKEWQCGVHLRHCRLECAWPHRTDRWSCEENSGQDCAE